MSNSTLNVTTSTSVNNNNVASDSEPQQSIQKRKFFKRRKCSFISRDVKSKRRRAALRRSLLLSQSTDNASSLVTPSTATTASSTSVESTNSIQSTSPSPPTVAPTSASVSTLIESTTNPPSSPQSSAPPASPVIELFPTNLNTTNAKQTTAPDPISNPSSFGPKSKRLNYTKQKKVRVAIEVIFERMFYTTYLPEELPKYVKTICDILSYPNHASVKRVILDVKDALDKDCEYDEERQKWQNEDQYKIEKGSFGEHLLSVWKEDGNSFKSFTRNYNSTFRASNHLPRVGIKCIRNAILRMNFIKASTSAVPQTDENNLLHRQARYNWFCQLLVRMGKEMPLPRNEEESEFRKRLDDKFIDRSELEAKNLTFDLAQVAWWDEIHFHQVGGSDHKSHLIFSRDKDGRYDPNGSFKTQKPKVSVIHFNLIVNINKKTVYLPTIPDQKEVQIRATSEVLLWCSNEKQRKKC